MRIWIALTALAVLPGCTPAPAPDLLVVPTPLDDRCSQWRIERDTDVTPGPVRACTPPTAAEVALACEVAAAIAADPEGLSETAGPALEVRVMRCELTDAEHGKARCRFERKRERGDWAPAEAALTRTYWVQLDELVFARHITWRADGVCAGT